MPDRDRKRVPDHWSDVLKGSISQGPPILPILGTRKMRVSRGCAKKARRRVEMKQHREVWTDNVEAGESYFVFNPAADW